RGLGAGPGPITRLHVEATARGSGPCRVLPRPARSTRGGSRTGRRGRNQAMKYLLLLNRTEDALPEPGTPAAQAMLREYTAAVQAMAEAGVLVDCAPLTATSAATTVRVRDGQPLLT